MKIGTTELTALVVTDSNNRVVTVISDQNTIITQNIKFFAEENVGDIRFIPMDDGSVQAVLAKEGMTFPVSAMTSEQFIAYSLKQKGESDIADIEAIVNKIPPEQREKLIELLQKKEIVEEEPVTEDNKEE